MPDDERVEIVEPQNPWVRSIVEGVVPNPDTDPLTANLAGTIHDVLAKYGLLPEEEPDPEFLTDDIDRRTERADKLLGRAALADNEPVERSAERTVEPTRQTQSVKGRTPKTVRMRRGHLNRKPNGR